MAAFPTGEMIKLGATITDIDWQRTFPGIALGPHRNPRRLAEKIRKDAAKLKSVSNAGLAAIIEERCARSGITPDGVPCFYIDRTRT